MQKILVIVGPTASGKSALAVHLARKFNGEIISADSRQVYCGLDIGTGKITKREMRGVLHHLLNVASPKKYFSADDFVRRGRAAIADISQRGKLPVIVGGTGFYIDALVGRIVLPDVPPDAKLRVRLQKLSAAKLMVLLNKCDPHRAKMMDTPSERNNKVRLVRAIEIVTTLGKIPENGSRGTENRSLDNALWVGIAPSDIQLRKNITARLSVRIKTGMIREAKHLHTGGLSYKRMSELGLEYRSLARFLQRKISRAELETELQSDIWRYARKQLGYWKRNKDIAWFDPKATAKIEKRVQAWLKK